MQDHYLCLKEIYYFLIMIVILLNISFWCHGNEVTVYQKWFTKNFARFRWYRLHWQILYISYYIRYIFALIDVIASWSRYGLPIKTQVSIWIYFHQGYCLFHILAILCDCCTMKNWYYWWYRKIDFSGNWYGNGKLGYL